MNKSSAVNKDVICKADDPLRNSTLQRIKKGVVRLGWQKKEERRSKATDWNRVFLVAL